MVAVHHSDQTIFLSEYFVIHVPMRFTLTNFSVYNATHLLYCSTHTGNKGIFCNQFAVQELCQMLQDHHKVPTYNLHIAPIPK